MKGAVVVAAAGLTALFASGALAALSSIPIQASDDAPRIAGTDVPAPKRTKFVPPEYPPEAQGSGARGIVILELLIDEQGRVISAEVARSVPPFDAAAVAAARQWQYEVTRIEGRPVKVRLTVPITFALRLPEVTRQPGIPELRQGASPRLPADVPARGSIRVVAEVTLDSDGQVAEATIKTGEPPWSQALLQAIRTWRFTPATDEAVVSFRVEAEFLPSVRGVSPRVKLHLAGLRRSEPVGEAVSAAAPEEPPTAAPESTPPPTEPSAAGAPSPTAPPSPRPSRPAEDEVITTPSLRQVERPGPGSSAIPEVTLEAGVPDLVKGRRPVVPPLARMSDTVGTVRVRFSVDASGITLVQEVEGPDLLKPAADSAVRSWVFRRVSTERIELQAELTYDQNIVKATVGQPR